MRKRRYAVGNDDDVKEWILHNLFSSLLFFIFIQYLIEIAKICES